MARTHLTKNQVSYPWNDANAIAIKAKHDEHDHALDALESGTTDSVVTIHPVTAVATSNVANLAAFTVAHDGLTMTATQRIALVAQSTGSQNGIYVLGTVGTGTAPLTRATDFDENAEAKPGTLIAVAAGTAGANTIWQLTNTTTPTIGTTALTFSQIFNATQLAVYDAATAGATKVGIYDNGALFTATTVDGALTEVKTLVDANTAAILQKRTVTVNDEDAGMTGASYAVNIGAALPANAVVVAHEINIIEQFAGEADTTITIGGTDADAIVASTDLDALAIGNYSGTAGVHPVGKFSGEQLVATFAATALEDLTAGQAVITVWFHVLA